MPRKESHQVTRLRRGFGQGAPVGSGTPSAPQTFPSFLGELGVGRDESAELFSAVLRSSPRLSCRAKVPF